MAKPAAPPTEEEVARALKRAVKANREATVAILRYAESLGIKTEIIDETGGTANHGTVAEERSTSKS